MLHFWSCSCLFFMWRFFVFFSLSLALCVCSKVYKARPVHRPAPGGDDVELVALKKIRMESEKEGVGLRVGRALLLLLGRRINDLPSASTTLLLMMMNVPMSMIPCIALSHRHVVPNHGHARDSLAAAPSASQHLAIARDCLVIECCAGSTIERVYGL